MLPAITSRNCSPCCRGASSDRAPCTEARTLSRDYAGTIVTYSGLSFGSQPGHRLSPLPMALPSTWLSPPHAFHRPPASDMTNSYSSGRIFPSMCIHRFLFPTGGGFVQCLFASFDVRLKTHIFTYKLSDGKGRELGNR